MQKSCYLRSLSIRSCHSTASPFLITPFWKFCFWYIYIYIYIYIYTKNKISIYIYIYILLLLFSTFVVLISILRLLMFITINYAKAVYV